MKKLNFVTILLLVTFLLVSFKEKNVEKVDFFKNDTIMIKKELFDFKGNKFYLYESDDSYAIYDNNFTFIEGSYETLSPYHNYFNRDLYYLGFGNYYYELSEYIINIFTNEKNVIPNMHEASYVLINNYSTQNINKPFMANDSQNAIGTYVDEVDKFVKIENAEYFEELSKFPKNYFGECGVVAASILLGYFDNFYHDDFIPNDLTYEARNYDEEGELSTNESKLYSEGKIRYEATGEYSLTDIYIMPGTTQALHDYLMDKYLQTILGLKPGDIFTAIDGYPMTATELYEMISAYLNDNASDLVDGIEYEFDSFIYTHSGPRQIISRGLPVLLVMTKFKIDNGNDEKQKSHIVVAYGYNGDRFMVHAGWESETNNAASYIISDATIQSYFSMDYDGQHVHNQNTKITNSDGIDLYFCPCGYVTRHVHSYIAKQYDKLYHIFTCSCGDTYMGSHKYQFDHLRNKNVCKMCGYIAREITEVIV